MTNRCSRGLQPAECRLKPAPTLIVIILVLVAATALAGEVADIRLLPVPATVTLLGVDGLYSAGKGVLIGTQNGTNPQRVIRIRLGPGGLAVAGVDPLASNEREFDDITRGTLAGNQFCFNATAQWALFGDDGEAPDAGKLKPASVLCIDRH